MKRYPALVSAIIACSLFLPMLVMGEVIAPVNPGRYIDPGYESDGYREFHLLSDYISSFIPRATGQLSDDREAFIDLWDPAVEAGMPTIQLGATSKAFPIFLLASLISNNPYVVLTIVCAFALVLSAAGVTLFAAGEGVRPEIAIGIGLLAILSWRMTFWVAFPQFIYGLGLTFLAMYLAQKYIRTGGWRALGWLVPLLYMMLLGSRPAFTVAYFYIAAAYVLWRLSGSQSPRIALRRFAGLVLAAACAVCLALPNYIDLAYTAHESLRAESPESFFLDGLHDIRSFASMLSWTVELLNGWGWAILPLLVVALLCIEWRYRAFWIVAAAIPLLLSVAPFVYVYFVRYLGFGISRMDPAWFALGPVLILIANGLSELLSAKTNRGPALILLVLFSLTWAVLAILFRENPAHGISPVLTATGAVSLAGALVAILWRKAWLLVVVLLVPALFSTMNRLPTRPLDSIVLTSPLLQSVKDELKPGQRHVKTADVVFSPRLVASLGAPTLHYIDSLSSEAANKHLAERLMGRPGLKLGRKFTSIKPPSRACREADYLRLLNVGVVLSGHPIKCRSRSLQLLGVVQQHYLYSPTGQPREVMWMEGVARAARREGISLPEKLLLAAPGGKVLERKRDFLQILSPKAQAESESVNLLVLSRQFHPAWQADAEGNRLETVRVNGFLLGVVLPKGLGRVPVEIQFQPASRWLAASVWFVIALSLVLIVSGMFSKVRRNYRQKRSAL